MISRSPISGESQVSRGSLRSFVLILMVATMAAGTMLAVFRIGRLHSATFPLPIYQDFLVLAIAAVSCLLGVWLREETRRSAHPAISFLEVGFFAQAALFAGQRLAFHIWTGSLDDARAQRWFGVLYSLWVAQFALAAALTIAWPALRHRLRRWSENSSRPLRLATWAWFSIYIVAGILGAMLFPEAPPVRSSFGICMGLGVIALVEAAIFYYRRRRPIVIPLTTGLLLFMLTRISAVLATPWQFLWWYSYVLYLGGLMLIAHGILEGQRVREREKLIARLEDLTVQLEEQSVRDPLTGAYNRRHLMNSLEAEFKKAVRGHLPLTLLVCDLDGFKEVNDTYGHPCGDFVLREIARRLAENGRESDVVGRCGGEEFWVLLPLTNRVGGQEVANKTLEAIRQPMVWEESVLTVTMSVGIADTFSPSARDVPSLIHEADRALYMAKRSGKNRAVTVDPLAFSLPT